MDEGDWLVERFQTHRAHLHAVAYRRRGQDPDLLVVTDGLGGDACLLGELTDAHRQFLP